MESISFVSFSPLHFVMTGWSEGGGGGAGRWLGKVFLFSPGDGSFHRMSGDMGVGPGCGGGGELLQEHKIGGRISKHTNLRETGSGDGLS